MTISKILTFSMMRRGVMLATILCISSVSSAQSWKELKDLPTAMYVSYFFDQNHGVVAGVGTMWKYTNGSWSTPSMPSGNPSYFSSIRMLKPGVLYATSGADYVWTSSDSGATWQNTTTPGSFALDCYISKDSLYATHQGTFARLDSNICIISNNSGSVPSYSTNGGTTWNVPSGNYTSNPIGGYGTYADTCRKMFFACAKTNGPAYYSLDSGRSWHATGLSDSSDILNGADGTVYHQVSYGVLCSVDGGTHWQSVGGPSAYGNQHNIFGFGPDGKYIVATYEGQVWMYSRTDSLVPPDPVTRPDTTETCPIIRMPVKITPFTRPWIVTIQSTSLGAQSLSPSDTSFTLSALPSPTQTILFNVNPTIAQHPSEIILFTTITDGCRRFDWTDTFTIFPVPLPISTPNVQFQNCAITRIPLVIQPNSQNLRMRVTISADSGWSVQPDNVYVNLNAGSRDTIWLTPTAPSLPNGTLITIHATDTAACITYVWDTTFTIGIQPVPVSWSWPDTVSISSCDSMRIPITFELASCDSLNVDQLTVLPSNNILNFESVPNLPRNRMDTIWLRYAPHGKLDDSTHYGLKIISHFVPEGIPLDTTLKLLGVSSGSPHPRASASSSFSMKECTPTLLPVKVTAAGCEDIRIDSLSFNNAGLIITGGPATADTLPVGQTDTLHYTLEALYPGTRTLDIDCHLYRLANNSAFDTTLSVSLNVSGSGEQSLISVTPAINVSNCTTSVIPIILHAPCDSATISQCKLTVDNSLNYSTNLTFPQILQTDQSDTLLISFPPQGLNLTTIIYAEIRGNYGGTTSSFDTTAQTRVTFVCANGGVEEGESGPALAITGLQSTSDQLLFNLAKSDPNITRCEAEIVSVLGEVVAKRSLQLTSSQNQIDWSLTGLASGEYFLRIVSGDNRLSSRFVVVR